MYTLIGKLSTRAFRVAWMLNELDVPFSVDPTPPRDPKLAAVNPSLKVPILKVGDDCIVDSVAICQYLADKHGKLTYPAGTLERAHQDSFTQFGVDDIELAIWVAAKHTFALPEEYRVPDVKRACRYDFDRAMRSLSARLGDRTYVMGDQLTVPDIVIGFCLMWAGSMSWTPSEGNVSEYVKRLMARPAFKKTVAMRDAQATAPAAS